MNKVYDLTKIEGYNTFDIEEVEYVKRNLDGCISVQTKKGETYLYNKAYTADVIDGKTLIIN